MRTQNNIDFLLEQLTLEANLCYGRNEKCKEYFRKLYPWDWLITHIKNVSLSIELRGSFLRLINYIYIDDKPHKLQKLVRTFKAFESSSQYIVSKPYKQIFSKEFLLSDLNTSRKKTSTL